MASDNSLLKAPLNGRKISEILTEISSDLTEPTVTIGQLRDALSGRIYGIFLLILALPNLIPLPAPGLSAILGFPLLLLTVQLTLGLQTPWFPKSIMQRHIKTAYIHSLCRYVMPYIIWLERYIMPRWTGLVHYPLDRIIALLCVFLSLLIMFPIPFGNALPALAISLFAIALLQRDGVFVVVGLITSIIACYVVFAAITALWLLFKHLLNG